MTQLTIVVAMARGRVIGVDNRLPWHLSADLKHFKALTLGKPVIMGRRTYDSIGSPLPKRRNIVITRQAHWQAEGVEVVSSLSDAVRQAGDVPEISIIGGAQIFEQCIDDVDCLQVTEIEMTVAGDVFFPSFNQSDWKEIHRAHHEEEGLHFDFVEYRRYIKKQ